VPINSVASTSPVEVGARVDVGVELGVELVAGIEVIPGEEIAGGVEAGLTQATKTISSKPTNITFNTISLFFILFSSV
jgi:hypothetical protein